MRIRVLIVGLALLSTAAFPATFLKIDGIAGDSKDQKHRYEVEIAAFQLAGNNLTFTKRIDVASPELFLHAATGEHIRQAVLTEETDARTYTLEGIVVSSVRQWVGVPTAEEVSFTFARITTTSKSPSKGSPLSSPAPSSRVSARMSANTGQSVSIFMKADSINGSSTDPAHPNEMVTNSLQFGIRNPGSVAGGGGGGAGKVQVQPIEVQKALDAASDPLMQHSQNGRHIPKVKLTLRQQGADFYFYTLQDVVVSDYSRTGSSETFKLQYSIVEVEFKGPQPPGSKGAPKAGYDVKANKKV